jgi:subtilisin family serine protease
MLLDDLHPELVKKLGPRLMRRIHRLESETGGRDKWLEKKLAETQDAAMRHPEDAQAQYALGNLLVQMGRPADAEQAYTKAISLQGRYLDARYALARLQNDQGRYDEALAALDQILKMDPYYYDAYLEKGYALARKDLFEEAVAAQAEGRKLREGSAIKGDLWQQSASSLEESEPLGNPLQTRGRAPTPAPDAVELLPVSVEFVDQPGYGGVMSQMDKVASSQQYARKSQDTFLQLLAKLGIGQYESRWFVNLVSLNVTYAQLVELLRALNADLRLYRDDICRIELTRGVEALIQGAMLTQNQVRALSNLSPVTVMAQPRSSASLVGADRLWSQGLTGAGRKVAVIDTGVCDAHPDLAGKLTSPPAAQSRLPYVYGEAIQGGNYFYEVAIRPGLTNVVVELVTGLGFGNEQLQSGLVSAKLDLYIYEPESTLRLPIPEKVEEVDGVFFRKSYQFQPRAEGGRYRVHIHGSNVDPGNTPWRGALFKLSAKDMTNYPGETLNFVGPQDDHAHGTHVAGVVAGTGASSNGTYKGVAPGAWLVSAKVLSYAGATEEADLLSAIEWAATQGVDVINISFGSFDEFCEGDCVICNAANKAVQDYRMVVVVAAGNEGELGAGRITCPGKAERVITVGSCDASGKKVSDFSSHGPVPGGRNKPDLVAPGEGIISCLSNRHFVSVRNVGGNFEFRPLTPLSTNSSYIGLSGTSMAAPHVAGAVALLLQADPTLTPERIKEILMKTAIPLPGVDPTAQGAGLLNLVAALKAVPQVVVDTVSSEQASYAGSPAEVVLNLKLRNNRTDKEFDQLSVDLAVQDADGNVVFADTEAGVDLEPAGEKTLEFKWVAPQFPQPGQYFAVASVHEEFHDFPPVPAGNVLVRRHVDHHLTGALPLFRYS